MKPFISLRFTLATILGSLIILLYTGCKKDNPSPANTTSEYYITATIGGKAWNTYGGNNTFVGGGQYLQGYLVAAAQLNNNSMLILTIPPNPVIGQPINFSLANFIYLVYTDDYKQTNPASPNEIIATSGTVVISDFDTSKSIIEGAFNCQGYNSYLLAPITISGNFKVPYVYNFNGLPVNLF
jgi:hypothetical protein